MRKFPKLQLKLKMLSAYLAVVVVSFLIGPTGAVFASNQCVRYATYNEKSGLCECDTGYNGLGDLCCDNANTHHSCNIGGDPWMTSYSGTRGRINFPCVGRVAVIKGTTRSRNQCQVELISTGRIVQSGAIYPDRIVVSYAIRGQSPKYFKIYRSTIHRPGDPVPITASQMYRARKQRMVIQRERILISYISQRKMWTISGCSTKVVFRPAADNKAIQDSRPGVCINVPKSSAMKPTGDLTNGDLCSITSPSQATPQNLLKNFVKNLPSLDAVIPVLGDYYPTCDHLKKRAETCGSARDKAVSSCVALFYHMGIRLCLTVSGIPGPAIVYIFTSCLTAHCSADHARCSRDLADTPPLKACFPSMCNDIPKLA